MRILKKMLAQRQSYVKVTPHAPVTPGKGH